MDMDAVKSSLCGISESRERQGEGIVPALPRSCHYGESCVGLPTVLTTASTVGEHAIVGMVGACTAGVPTINAPAKSRESGELTPRAGRAGERSPLRLRGGDEKEDSDGDEASFEEAVASPTDEQRAEWGNTRRASSPQPGTANPAPLGPRPGPSGVRRSRSRNRIRPRAPGGAVTRRRKQGARLTRQTRRMGSTASSSDHVGDPGSTENLSSDQRDGTPRIKRFGSLPSVAAISSEEDDEPGKSVASNKRAPPTTGGSLGNAGNVSGDPPPPKRKMMGSKSARWQWR